jgi:hypothetical protein
MTQQREAGYPEDLNPALSEPIEEVAGYKRRRRAPLASSTVIETDFAQLEDGSIVEMIEDPEVPSRSMLAVFKNGSVDYVRKVKANRGILVAPSRDSELVKNVRLPRGVESYESVRSLLHAILSILDQCVELKEMYKFLLANFVLTSWLADKLPVAPYIAIVGLPSSGKSTLLQVLRLLCRRSILTADITSAAFYHVCDRLTPTLLIDETNTAGPKSNLFHLLRVGFTPGTTALRKNRSFKAFGVKVVTWIELPRDAALNSRCIVIPLKETERIDLKRVTAPEIVEAADHLQKQLLQFRFERLHSLTLPKIPGSERLHSRIRDLYEALALANGDPGNCEQLVEAFEILQDTNREPLLPNHTAVLRTLFLAIHTLECRHFGHIMLGDVVGFVNCWLAYRHERLRVAPREVGSILTSLGLSNRKRTRWGYRVWLGREEQKLVHNLVNRYGLDCSYDEPDAWELTSEYRLRIAEGAYETCELCKALQSPRGVRPRAEQIHS